MAATLTPGLGLPSYEWTTEWIVPNGVQGQNQMSWGTWEAPVMAPIPKSDPRPILKAPAALIAPSVLPAASFVPLASGNETWGPANPEHAQKAAITLQTPPSVSPSSFVDVSRHDDWKDPSLEAPLTPRDPHVNNLPLQSPQRSIKLRQAGGTVESEIRQQDLYKTEYCRSWRETGACRYGSKCQFAHGEHELRPVFRHPKYKTEICRNFSETGTCPYGSRCRFVHYQRGRSSNSDLEAVASDINEVSLQLSNLSLQQKNAAPVEETKEKAKGSRLPFFQKLRRNTSAEKDKDTKNR